MAAVAIAALALPASASADLVVSQAASAKPVKKGELVTITVSATNPGPATAGSDESQVEVFPLRGSSEHAAANPYESVTPSQGACTITPTGAYQVADCSFGELAPGASAQIVAVLRVNESMNHVAAPKVGTWSELNVAASTPPTVAGARQIRLTGVPGGCVLGDFALTVTVQAPRVRKVSARDPQGRARSQADRHVRAVRMTQANTAGVPGGLRRDSAPASSIVARPRSST
jgi:hypothetical protein